MERRTLLSRIIVQRTSLFFVVVFLVLAALCPSAVHAAWTTEAVDAPKYFTNFYQRSIAIDKVTNQPHIAYGGDHLYHAYFNGTQWQYETVDNAPGVGHYASIAIDSFNYIHISYFDSINYDLKYATNASGSWVTYTIDSTGYAGWHTSIVLDSNNKAHISYYVTTNSDLKYATNASGSWVTFIIDSAVGAVQYTSIALDTNNKAHISYYDSTTGDLKYATNVSDLWVMSIIDSTGDVGQYTSIVSDSNNKVHVSYYDNTNSDLKYATNASGSWVASSIDSVNSVGQYTSIAIDSNNKAHVSYYDNTNSDLKYATNASGSWVKSTIDSTGLVGWYTSIVFDLNNKAHISYYDSTNNTLKYASKASGSWVTSIIDSTGSAGWYTSIVLDSNNKAHISYQDNSNADLKYTTNVSGLWVTSTIDSTGYVGQYTAIAIDSNNKAHISYQDNSNADLKYTTNVSGSWVTSSIDSTVAVGKYTSMTIDSNNKAHVSYYDETNKDLKYATNASGVWVTSTIDSAGDVGWYTSIVLDSNNKAHISYYDNTNSDLKYATNASGAWVKSTIDSVNSVGQYTSIAIDSNNKAHVSYYDNTNYDLKYATNASGSWVKSTIDSVNSVGQYTSIAIDSNNKAHVSYYDNTNYDLKYATNASGSWVTSTIDSTGVVGWDTSIAIDSNNKAHVSYYDNSNGDLKYATDAEYNIDNDGDGYAENEGDCDDNDPAIFPGTIEVCDGNDNNCNGEIDEGFPPLSIYFRDLDMDGYGDSASATLVCSQPAGYVSDNTDCDDNNAAFHPFAPEICDDADNNCNGQTDEGFMINAIYRDADGDSYGDSADSIQSCQQHIGYVADNTDCNDSNAAIKPGATEVCDGVDNNCSGEIDEGFVVTSFYRDADGDSYGNPILTITACTPPSGYVTNASDCLDSDASVNPGAAEITTNCKDDDCNPATSDSITNNNWLSECVDSAGNVGMTSRIAVDSLGILHISYYDYTNHQLKYATNVSGQWISLIIDPMWYGGYNSIAVDSNNKVHISYYDSNTSNRDLRYATNASGSWIITVVDSTGSVGDYNSIAVDSNNKVHISYTYAVSYSDYNLKYATNASGTWVVTTIDAYQDTGHYSSIAIDANDKVHISYVMKPASLKHATNSTGTWVITELIGSAPPTTITSTDIAVDLSSNVHISCSTNVHETRCFNQYCGDVMVQSYLRYVRFSAGSWNVPVIDTDGIVGLYNSITLDSSGNVHISYSDDTYGDLKYANNASGQWMISTIDSDGDLGTFNSIAFFGNSLHVSYYDDSNITLRHAVLSFSDVDNDGDGYTENQGDCDDGDPIEYPVQTWYLDADGDGYSEGTVNTSSCTRPSGYKAASELINISGDCDDGNPAVNPAAFWYPDIDADGYGNPAISLQQCMQPQGYVLNNTDCNDYDVNIYPGGPPVRIARVTPVYLSLLQEAYDAADEGEIIEGLAGTWTENLNFNLSKTVFIDGGYDCGYSAITGKTILNGNLSIIDGVIEIGNVELW